jgi:outer membrane lipoprotein-sorting protein
MTRIIKILLVIFLNIIVGLNGFAQNLTAKEIIKKADEKFQGEKSSISTMTMVIKRPTWERSITFKNWTKGRHYSLTLITSPAKEKGQTFLKRHNDMWNWNPVISRMIKLPPSMMSQGWMGSDYTNDDILKESSIVVDYTHKIIGEENINDHQCFKIELIPLEEAAVVWGKVIKWISKKDFLQMKSEYFDEDDYLVKTDLAYDVKMMDGRTIPTKIEIIPAEKKKQKTIVYINTVKFNSPIADNFFSQQRMKRIK